jgi:general secretion pathway protein B
MSFILDALRKSEIERQRQSGPSMAEFPVAREDRRLPVALLAIGLLLAVNVAVVLFFLLRDARAPGAAPAPSPTTSSTANAGPVTTLPAPNAAAAPTIAAPPIDEFANQPLQVYEAPATEPPDAPDPTLIPDTPVAGPEVTYFEAPPTTPDSLAAQGGAGLPELTVDLHIFTDDPARRAVFINGRRYVQGAQILEGPVVEEITREGAVLNYRGRRFLLPRL